MSEDIENEVTQTTEVVPRRNSNASDLLASRKSCYTSLDKNNPKHLAIMIKCLEKCDKGAEDVLGEIINIQHVMCNNIEKLNKATGEIESGILTKLIMVDGSTVGTTSKGIFMGLQGVINIIGAPPWEHGIAFKIQTKRTEKGYKMLYLEFVGINNPPEAAIKKVGK